MCVSLVLCIILQVIKLLFLVFSNPLSNLSKQLSKENESIRKETTLVPKWRGNRKIKKGESLHFRNACRTLGLAHVKMYSIF